MKEVTEVYLPGMGQVGPPGMSQQGMMMGPVPAPPAPEMPMPIPMPQQPMPPSAPLVPMDPVMGLPGDSQPAADQPQRSWNRNVWAMEAPPQEELLFRTYPYGVEFAIAFESVPNWQGTKAEEINSRQVFLMGRKTDHEKLEAILAQMKESQESEEKAIAANKPILRRYKKPTGLSVDVVPFIKDVTKDAPMVFDQKTQEIVIWARKPDQDKVAEMLEQITQATEKVREQ